MAENYTETARDIEDQTILLDVTNKLTTLEAKLRAKRQRDLQQFVGDRQAILASHQKAEGAFVEHAKKLVQLQYPSEPAAENRMRKIVGAGLDTLRTEAEAEARWPPPNDGAAGNPVDKLDLEGPRAHIKDLEDRLAKFVTDFAATVKKIEETFKRLAARLPREGGEAYKDAKIVWAEVSEDEWNALWDYMEAVRLRTLLAKFRLADEIATINTAYQKLSVVIADKKKALELDTTATEVNDEEQRLLNEWTRATVLRRLRSPASAPAKPGVR